MKKILLVLSALILCLCVASGISAQDTQSLDVFGLPNEAELLNDAVVEAKSPAAANVVGDWIRFIPTEMEVSYNKVTVYGYFVNLNPSHSVKTFREFEMDVYRYGNLLVSGEFGTINDFTVNPLGVKYQSFTFNGSHNLDYGTTTCGDSYYCTTGFRFTSVQH